MTFRDQLAAIKTTYPNGTKIKVTYGGSGDSFDGFDSAYLTEKDADGKEDHTDIYEFTDNYRDLLNAAIEATDDTFCNDGAHGNIIIDLIEGTVVAEHYQYEITSNYDNDYTVDLDKEVE